MPRGEETCCPCHNGRLGGRCANSDSGVLSSTISMIIRARERERLPPEALLQERPCFPVVYGVFDYPRS